MAVCRYLQIEEASGGRQSAEITPTHTHTPFYIWTHKYKHIHSYLPKRFGGWDASLATGGGDTRNNPSWPETEIAALNLCGHPRLCLLAWEQDCTDAFYRTLQRLKDYGMRKRKNTLFFCSPSLAGDLIADYVSITAFLRCPCINTSQRKSGVEAPSIDKASLGRSIVY